MASATISPLTKATYQRRAARGTADFPHINPRCQHVGHCGGCNLQALDYAHQQQLKRQLLAEVEQTLELPTAIPLTPATHPWRYRNKLELTFSTVNGLVRLGLHARRSFWDIVDLDDCWLAPEPMIRVARTIRAWVQAQHHTTYDPRQHQGFFRYLILRYSHATQRLLACLITTPGVRDILDELTECVQREHPEVASVYWGISAKPSDVAVPDTLMHLAGVPTLDERIGPFWVDVHPLTFLQPNVVQAELMYTTIASWARARGVQTAWDLYAGMGLIALYARQSVRSVFCVESEPRNIEFLQRAAARNHILGLTCRVDRAETFLDTLASTMSPPDCIIMDPPRAGLHPRVVRALARQAPAMLIYLSCNPLTLASDLAAFRAAAPSYRIRHIQGFDMFPQTTHLEILTCLER